MNKAELQEFSENIDEIIASIRLVNKKFIDELKEDEECKDLLDKFEHVRDLSTAHLMQLAFSIDNILGLRVRKGR